jgi:hypothetical protein
MSLRSTELLAPGAQDEETGIFPEPGSAAAGGPGLRRLGGIDLSMTHQLNWNAFALEGTGVRLSAGRRR